MTTSVRPRPARSPRSLASLLPAALSAVLLLSSCGAAEPAGQETTAAAPATTSATASAAAVVVPGLDGSATAAPIGVTVPGMDAPDAVTSTVTTTPQEPVETTTAAEPPAEPTQEAPAPAPTSTAVAAPTGEVLQVQLSGCEGCSVIASHRDVAGGRSAALVSRSGRGALVSVDGSGGAVGVVNIPYGAEFPAPEGGLLPCDDAGHCIVTARQNDGRAVLSAFSLDGNGAWTDLSGDSGFPSATAKAGPLMVDGGLGLAVQDSDGAATVWMVLAWSGSRFEVLGCAVDGAMPAADALDPALCLS